MRTDEASNSAHLARDLDRAAVSIGSNSATDQPTPFDRANLSKLWEQHRRWVAAILLAYKPREIEVDDLLQDVAMSVVRHGHELRDGQAFKPWLRAIAINAARASARSQKLRRHARLTTTNTDGTETTIEPSDASHGADALQLKELDAEARRILNLALDLPDGYREPLLLKSLRDMSYRQIGETMGLPETTIETRIARARKMLRELATGSKSSETPTIDKILKKARNAGVMV